MTYSFTFLVLAAILGNVALQRTVAEEKPTNLFQFYPVDLKYVEDNNNEEIEILQSEEFSVSTQNTERSEEILFSPLMVSEMTSQSEESFENVENDEKVTSDKADTDEQIAEKTEDGGLTGQTEDDEICDSDTVYNGFEYIAKFLENTNLLESFQTTDVEKTEKEDDKIINADNQIDWQTLNNDENQLPISQDSMKNNKKIINSDILSNLIFKALLESTKKQNDLSKFDAVDMQTYYETLHEAESDDIYSSEETSSEIQPENEDTDTSLIFNDQDTENLSSSNATDDGSPEIDIGKLLAEADLFDYELFARVYFKQVTECMVTTVNVSTVFDLSTGIFEAIDLVHKDLLNKFP